MELINKKLVLKIINDMTVDEGDYKRCTNLIEQLNVIESRPTGEWVGIDEEPYEEWECNNCGNIITNVDVYELEYHKYCHKCGAEMSIRRYAR